MRIGYILILSGVTALHHGRSEARGITQQIIQEKRNTAVSGNAHADANNGINDVLDTNIAAKEILSLHEDIPRLVQYELDKHGLLIRLSIVLSLIVLLIGGATAAATCVFTCVEGINRGKRIKAWEASRKGVSTPTQFTQSYGEPETDLETNILP